MARVFVGMSGGVDSSVSVLLLQQAGYQVSGIHLRLVPGKEAEEEDARLTAQRLGVPFQALDLSQTFRSLVMRHFAEEYEAGRTPNPCVTCNRLIKFGALMDRIPQDALLATGHYVQIGRDAGRYLLKRGADRGKDQSYFLYTLTQAQLSRTLFPLGGLTKAQVRRLAEDSGLVNASKRDSQDICFVPGGDYAAVIERLLGRPSPTGSFLDLSGRVLGRHKGFIRYTRGQHKGLGLSTEQPLYVLDKDPRTHAIRLGPDDSLWSTTLTAGQLNWISIPALAAPITVTVKTRYTRREASAIVAPLEDGVVRVVFDQPQRAVTAGQAVVFYDGEVVVGGGTILP